MEIVRIFDNLFAFKYDDESMHELERLFEFWQDIEYLEDFFSSNSSDLQRDIWHFSSVEDAIFKTLKYAKHLQKKIVKLCTDDGVPKLQNLESLFKPLIDCAYRIEPFNMSKATDNWLRLYALKADVDVYVITGGAIKLTRTMQERDHTALELKKIEACRKYLLESGIVDSEGLIELVEL